jgi:hypothetical protein
VLRAIASSAALIGFMFLAPTTGLAQTAAPAPPQQVAPGPPTLVRLRFIPPVGSALSYRVTQRDRVTFGTAAKERGWHHIIELKITKSRPPDGFEGSITLRDVRAESGSGDDPFYVIAKSLEDRVLPAVVHEFGSPVDVGWPAIKPSIAAALSRYTDAPTAKAIEASLGQFDALDGVAAVARPLFLASIVHSRGFYNDASVYNIPNYEGAGALMIDGRWAVTVGGRHDGEPAIIDFAWRIGVEPSRAARELAPMLQALISATVTPADLPRARAEITAQVARGVEFTERGEAEYDEKLALVRRITHRYVLATSSYRKEATMEMVRIAP